MLPFTSTMAVCLLRGAGGENCQCSTAWPGATAHHPVCATRKIGWFCGGGWFGSGQPLGQVERAPCAYANEPGAMETPLNMQLPGPLHTSFCSIASKVVRSGVTVLVGTQLLAISDTRAYCRME